MRCRLRVTSVIALGLFAVGVAQGDELTTTAGKKLTGTLVAVDKDGVTFKSGEAEAKVPGKDIVLIDLGNKVVAPGKEKQVEIELTDGSILKVASFLIKGKKVEVKPLTTAATVPQPTFELPMTSVFSVLRGAEDQKNRDDWKKMLATRGKRDLYVIRQQEGLNFVQGTVIEGDETGTRVTFEKEDGAKEQLSLARATGGLVFYQKLPAQIPATLCNVVDVFGNTFTAQAVEISPSGVKVQTVSGVTVAYTSPAGIAKLDYARGNVAYISDLDPIVLVPEPPEPEKKAFNDLKGLTQPEPFTKDRRPGEGALKMDNVTYPKGVCIAVDTVVTLNLNGDYREFKAMAGFPDGMQSDAAELKLTIEADGQVIFSEKVRGNEKPKGIVKDVKGVKVIRILVERDFPTEVGNYLILADARVQK